MSPPWSKKKPQQALLYTCFTLVSNMSHSSTLKMEATYSSETSVDIQWTIWRYIPEDRTLWKLLILHMGFSLRQDVVSK
jgi:hypothetical protein